MRWRLQCLRRIHPLWMQTISSGTNWLRVRVVTWMVGGTKALQAFKTSLGCKCNRPKASKSSHSGLDRAWIAGLATSFWYHQAKLLAALFSTRRQTPLLNWNTISWWQAKQIQRSTTSSKPYKSANWVLVVLYAVSRTRGWCRSTYRSFHPIPKLSPKLTTVASRWSHLSSREVSTS